MELQSPVQAISYKSYKSYKLLIYDRTSNNTAYTTTAIISSATACFDIGFFFPSKQAPRSDLFKGKKIGTGYIPS